MAMNTADGDCMSTLNDPRVNTCVCMALVAANVVAVSSHVAVNVSDIVEIREVGLRDGLQLIKTQLTTQQKLQWVKKQVKAGFTEIEVTSFVPPKLLPQFSDANEMVISSNKIQNLKATALVLNLKGATNSMGTLSTPNIAI